MTYPGYYGRLLRIDLSNRTARLESRPEEWFRRYVGGGMLATRLLLDETPSGLDAFDPHNRLVFASSVLAGHPAVGLARFTVAAKSPLTGGIGETRAEGPWGVALKGCGADALVIEGAAERPTALIVRDGEVAFEDASTLWGRTVGETTDALVERFGDGAHVAAIGPAGERRVRFASVVTDRTHQAARMGMGAVMGAKGLKAIVLTGDSRPAPHDPATLARLTGAFADRIPGNDLSLWQKEPPGFSCWLYLHGVDAALCVRNYSRSTIEGLEAFRTEAFMARYQGDAVCPGCPNDCIKVLHPLDGDDLDPRASGIHQEITGAMGPNLGITDLDWILRANNAANQLGLDPTSLGFVLSFAMELRERGIVADEGDAIPHFGDADGAFRLMQAIAMRQGIGDLLAEGTRRATSHIGNGAARYAMEVKGLEMVCFEPRSQTNLALGYATAPIGPRYDICEHDWDYDTRVGWEHTLHLSRAVGVTRRVPMDYLGPDKVPSFKALNNLWSAADALDLCLFAIAPTRILSLREMAELLAAVTGWETGDYEIMRMGERRNHLMRLYNVREGLTARDDTLPDRFFEEPIAAGPRAGDVLDRDRFREAIDTYYALMGWDAQGRPLATTLLDHGIEGTV